MGGGLSFTWIHIVLRNTLFYSYLQILHVSIQNDHTEAFFHKEVHSYLPECYISKNYDIIFTDREISQITKFNLDPYGFVEERLTLIIFDGKMWSLKIIIK
jgi:hypothetical protein